MPCKVPGHEVDSGTPTSTASPCRPLEVASTARFREKTRPFPGPGILETPPGPWDPLAPSLSALSSPQADRSASQASLVSPFSSPLGWTCDTQCFSVTSPSCWNMCSFDRRPFHLLIISVDARARGIRGSNDWEWKANSEVENSERTDRVAQDGWGSCKGMAKWNRFSP